jgi:hypothetical protein
MKKQSFISLGIIVVAIVCFVTACSKQGTTVDTAPLEKSFAGADASVKPSADKAVSDVKAGNYSAAMADLQSLGGNAKLTPAQQQAIKDVVGQVQQALANAGKQAADSANKAATDLQKSLPK